MLLGLRVYVDMRDFTTAFRAPPGIAGPREADRAILPLGTTTVTNKELLDPLNSGEGILRRIWTDPHGDFRGLYRVGQSDCMALLAALAKPNGPLGSGVQANDELAKLLKNYQQYTDAEWQKYPGIAASKSADNVGLRYRKVQNADFTKDALTVFPVDSSDLSRIFPGRNLPRERTYQDPCSSSGNEKIPEQSPSDENRFQKVRVAGNEFFIPPSAFESECSLDSRQSRLWTCEHDSDSNLEMKEIALMRTLGKSHMLAMTSKDTIEGIGVAGSALGATFVLLDYVNQTWIGAAIGTLVSYPLITSSFLAS